MGQLDVSSLTLAYRPVSDEFASSLAAVQWVSVSYTLVLAVLLIPVGRVADAHGRKLVYLYGFVVFTAGSVACGLAPSLAALIVFRVVHGSQRSWPRPRMARRRRSTRRDPPARRVSSATSGSEVRRSSPGRWPPGCRRAAGHLSRPPG